MENFRKAVADFFKDHYILILS